MNSPFFITGLPRTRTAWLANFCTTGPSLCYHEPTQAPATLLARHPGHLIGVADSTLVFRAHELLEQWPEARWLFVERDPNEAKRSLIRFTRDTVRVLGRDIEAVFQAHAAAAVRVKEHPGTLQVSYNGLDARLPEICQHLGVPYSPARHEILAGVKVEQHFARLYKERMGR